MLISSSLSLFSSELKLAWLLLLVFAFFLLELSVFESCVVGFFDLQVCVSGSISLVLKIFCLVMEEASVALLSEEIKACFFGLFVCFFNLGALVDPFLFGVVFTDLVMVKAVCWKLEMAVVAAVRGSR